MSVSEYCTSSLCPQQHSFRRVFYSPQTYRTLTVILFSTDVRHRAMFLRTNSWAHARGRLTGLRQLSPRSVLPKANLRFDGTGVGFSCAISLRFASTAHDLGGRQNDQKHVSIDRLLHADHIPPLPLRKKIMHKARRKSR